MIYQSVDATTAAAPMRETPLKAWKGNQVRYTTTISRVDQAGVTDRPSQRGHEIGKVL